MPYQIQYFDDIGLPLYNPQQDHSPMAGESTLLDSIGGVFDWRGDDMAYGRRQSIALSGVYWGETTYIGDEAGNLLGDEAGNLVIGGEGPAMLRDQLLALAAKVRQRGTLWRVHLPDDSVRQWKTARFLQMSHGQVVEDRLFKAQIACTFETAMAYWHAEEETVLSASAAAGDTVNLVVANAGMAVQDARLTVTCTSSTISAVSVSCAALGIDLSWTGTLGMGETLVIDAGDVAVPSYAEDAYSGFALESGHTAAGWLPIERGSWTFVVQVTGGDSEIEMRYSEQFA